MRSVFLKFLTMIFLITLVSCGSSQKKEIKTVTALGLSEGISSVLLGQGVLKCSDAAKAKQYIQNRVCEALKADCVVSSSPVAMSMSSSFVKRYACKAAVKIAMPVIMPSKHLPVELKEAGCKAQGLDSMAKDYADQFCSKL